MHHRVDAKILLEAFGDVAYGIIARSFTVAQYDQLGESVHHGESCKGEDRNAEVRGHLYEHRIDLLQRLASVLDGFG